MDRILVTGANGFIGRTLCEVLPRPIRAVRKGAAPNCVIVGDLATADWSNALIGAEAVIHLAGLAHTTAAPEAYRRTNVEGTLRLARAAKAAGIRRFVYLSSIKADNATWETDPYGASKLEAERLLMEQDMEVVIIRPPLVYGPGVKANFLRLMRWVDQSYPLPFGAIRNHRSLVSVWNLCDLLVNVLTNPEAPGHSWLVSDGEDLSTPELMRRIARAMRRPTRLLTVPVGILKLAGAVTRRQADVERLCGSLAVDITSTRDALGWSPPLTVDDGIARTVEWYLSR